MKALRFLLFPFAILYSLITSIRNRLYDSGRWRSAKFSLPLINVGNLNTGGSGKTPHIEYLIRLLKDNYKIAVLSRGYGRQTKGFIIADSLSDAARIGDEPSQILNKFPDITVTVGEDRLLAIPQLLKACPETQVILMDDAYQHRSVRPGLNILLTAYQSPFYTDFILPVGNLRENISGKKRADIIIVTKCPENLTEKEKNSLIRNINASPSQHIFFSTIRYGHLYNPRKSSEQTWTKTQKYTLLTGIASEDRIYSYLDKIDIQYDKIRFRDHHRYTASDIRTIIQKTLNYNTLNPVLITTEKDFTRLKKYEQIFSDENITICVLPIEMKILDDEITFNQVIFDYVESDIMSPY